MKKRKAAKPPALSDTAQRVLHLAELLSGGSHRGFARLVGCSQAVVSKIAAGQQEPGPNVLARIEHLPQVNSDWLRTGKGTPMIPVSAESNPSVPLAESLLPGLLGEHPELLTSRRVDVSVASYRDTIYAVEGAQCQSAAAGADEQFLPDDIIFVDTDPRRWLGNVQSLNGRRCVLSLTGEAPGVVVMCRVQVTYSPQKKTWDVTTVWDDKPLELLSVSTDPIASPRGREKRYFDLGNNTGAIATEWSICGKAIWLNRVL